MNTIKYGMFSIFAMALVVLMSIGIEYIIQSVDIMLVPCQHGSKYVNNKCSCLNTPFTGKYCETCLCQNGFCMLGKGTTPSKTDYGCRCEIDTKYWGFFCDQCNTNITIINGPNKNTDIGKLKCKIYAQQNNLPFEEISDLKKPGFCFVSDKVYYNIKTFQECVNCLQHDCSFNQPCMSPYKGALCDNVCFEGKLTDLEQEICSDIESHGGQCDYCIHGTCGNTCQCDDDWVGKHCNQTCNCNGHGKCVLYGQKAGCLCTEGYYGENCDFGCGDCNGVCKVDYDKKTAFCECKRGYRGKHCQLKCPALTCNGHGTCNENATCECTDPYKAPSCNCTDALCVNGACDGDHCKCTNNFAGQYCRKCKANWYGPNCDAYCDQSLCNGHCLYKNGIQCKCKANTKNVYNGGLTIYSSVYSNELNTSCKICGPGYYPSHTLFQNNQDYFNKKRIYVECQVQCTTEMCNGGNCTDTLNMCKCAEGFDPASRCLECLDGFYPQGKCNVKCDDKECGSDKNRGKCGPDGTCLCENGWSGSKCNVDCPNQCGAGTCVVSESAELLQPFLSNLSSCQCPTNYYGEGCQYTCQKPPWKSVECNAMGDCDVYPIYRPIGSQYETSTCSDDSDCSFLNSELKASVEYFAGAGPFCYKNSLCNLTALKMYAPSDTNCAYDWDQGCKSKIPNCQMNTAFTRKNLTKCAKYKGIKHLDRCYEQARSQYPQLVRYEYFSDQRIQLHNAIKESFSRQKPTKNWCNRVLQNRMYVGPFDSSYALDCGTPVEMPLLEAIRERKSGCRVIDTSSCPSNCTKCTVHGCKKCLPGFMWNGAECEKALYRIGYEAVGFQISSINQDPFECLLSCNTTYASYSPCVCGNTIQAKAGKKVYKKCTYSDMGCIDQDDGATCVSDSNCKNYCADKCCKYANCKVCGNGKCDQCVDNAEWDGTSCVFKGFSEYVEASCNGIDDWCYKNPILFFGDTYLQKSLAPAQYFVYNTKVIDFWVFFEELYGISSALIFQFDNQLSFRFYVSSGHFVFQTSTKRIRSERKTAKEWINVVVEIDNALHYEGQNITIGAFNNYRVEAQTVSAYYDEIVLHNASRTKDCIDIEYMFPLVEDMAELCGKQYIHFDNDLDWNTYCLFSEANMTCNTFDFYEDYDDCRELFSDTEECVNKSFAYDWSNYGKIPGCNYTTDYSYCENRPATLKPEYDKCLNELKNNHQGVCSALKCNCNSQFNTGVSGHACQLTCPIGSNGEPCGGDKAGYCSYTDEQLDFLKTSNYTPRTTLIGVCRCFDGKGGNCDMECRECHNKTNYTFVFKNKTYDALNAMCDKGRGMCTCLPPYVGLFEETIKEWFRNSTQTVYRFVYGTPQKDILKVKMMQGKEAFMTYISNETNLDIFIENMESNPQQYTCIDRPCSMHDTRLLDVYAETSSKYNFNCNSTCPGTVDNIPCSGHGYCSSGMCTCDVAPVLKSNSPNVPFSLDTTGWRGDDCSIMCPGFDGNMSSVCSGHGECNSKGNCQCDEGYVGDHCQFQCPGSTTCSGHGTCATTIIHLKNKRLSSCKWSECKNGIRTRHCPHFQYESCFDNYTRWSMCTDYHYRYVNDILQRRDCGSTQCNSLCQFCDSECFQCVENAADIGYGCTCLPGYKKVGNQCKKSRRLRQSIVDNCIYENNVCVSCKTTSNTIFINGKCYPLPCPDGQRFDEELNKCAVPQKDHLFVPIINKSMHQASCATYKTKESDKNDNSIRSADECNVAAKVLNYTYNGTTTSSNPAGCFYSSGVFYNNGNTNENCSATKKCLQRTSSEYIDSKTGKCTNIIDKPFIKFDVFYDKNTPEEIKQSYECQLLSDTHIECPKCVCFDDDKHGRWDSFGCDRCQKGYGNSQCNQVCPGYDGINEQSMCNYPHGMCQFGTIKQGDFLEHPPVQCMCGENGIVSSGIQNNKMQKKSVAYTSFGTLSSDSNQVVCTGGKEDTCFHFDLNNPCTKCESGWSGKNCKYTCDKCFANGVCNSSPSTSSSTCSCTRPDLWEMNCCPYGFVVEDIETFDGLSDASINQISIPSTYDNTGMSKWCKACPGVKDTFWLDSDLAKSMACGGPSRGVCGRQNNKAHCSCYTETNGGYSGFNCRCKDTLQVGYKDEQTDYGCFGIGKCSDISDKYKYRQIEDKACNRNEVSPKKIIYNISALDDQLHIKIEKCAANLGSKTWFAINTEGTECEIYSNTCSQDKKSGDYNIYDKTGYFLYEKDQDFRVYCSGDGGIFYEDTQYIAEPGHYVPTGSQVQQFSCLKGQYQPKPGESLCKPTPKGSFTSKINSMTLSVCPDDTFIVIEGSSGPCKACHNDKKSISLTCPVQTPIMHPTKYSCDDSTSKYTQNQCTFTKSTFWSEMQYSNVEKIWDITKVYSCYHGNTKLGDYYGGFSKCLTDCYNDHVYNQLSCQYNSKSIPCTDCQKQTYNVSEMISNTTFLCIQNRRECLKIKKTNKTYEGREYNFDKGYIVHENYLNVLQQECQASNRTHCVCKIEQSGVCHHCLAGTYNKEQSLIKNQAECTACEIGKYTDQVAQYSCKTCGNNQYQDQTGQTSCKYCSHGKYSLLKGLTSDNQCCYEGYIQTSNGCKACYNGLYIGNFDYFDKNTIGCVDYTLFLQKKPWITLSQGLNPVYVGRLTANNLLLNPSSLEVCVENCLASQTKGMRTYYVVAFSKDQNYICVCYDDIGDVNDPVKLFTPKSVNRDADDSYDVLFLPWVDTNWIAIDPAGPTASAKNKIQDNPAWGQVRL